MAQNGSLSLDLSSKQLKSWRRYLDDLERRACRPRRRGEPQFLCNICCTRQKLVCDAKTNMMIYRSDRHKSLKPTDLRCAMARLLCRVYPGPVLLGCAMLAGTRAEFG